MAGLTDQILQMRSQGLDNNQIVQSLQRDGFQSHEIFDAMNQVDKQSAGPIPQPGMPPAGAGMPPPLGSAAPSDMPPPPTGAGMPPPPQDMSGMPPPQQGTVGQVLQMPSTMPPPGMPPPGQPGMPPPGAAPLSGAPGMDQGDASTQRIEEIAESIIEEKWTELIKNVNKIVEWKEKTDSRLTTMETNFSNLKDGFDKLHEGVLGKITEYEKGINNLGTEIKALEKVFSKILPTLTENVNELSRVTQKIKGKK